MQIELNWLLDDAVHSVQSLANHTWQSHTWQRLKRSEDLHDKGHSSESKQQVRLRVDLAELTQLWRWRIQDRYVAAISFCMFSAEFQRICLLSQDILEARANVLSAKA